MFSAMIGKSDRQKGKGYATKYNNKVKTFERPLKNLIDCVECFKVVLSEAGAAYMDEFQSVPPAQHWRNQQVTKQLDE